MKDAPDAYVRDFGHASVGPRRLSSSTPKLLLAALAFPIIVLILVEIQPWWTYEELLTDSFGVVGVYPIIGIVSNFSAFAWATAAIVCLFSAAALHGKAVEARLRGFLFASGALSFILLIDDYFMIHEMLSGDLLIKERYPKLFFIALAIAWGVRYLGILMQLNRLLLGAAVLCFAGSLFLDNPAVADLFGNAELVDYMFEDGIKFVGVWLWATFLTDAALRIIRATMRN